MIRRVLLVALTLSAVGLGAVVIASAWRDVEIDLPVCLLKGTGRAFKATFHRFSLEVSARYETSRPAPFRAFVDPFPSFDPPQRVAPGVTWMTDDNTFAHPSDAEWVTLHFRELALPAWPLPLFLAAYPITVLVRGPLRRRRRRRRGLCLKCGYNLTGNTSGVCPECGSGISACGFPPDGGAKPE